MIEFQGRTFYRDKATGYYRTDAKSADRAYLHRAVYSSVYGNIPHGWHVHHKDEDTENNVVENLEALPLREHLHKVHRRLRRSNCLVCDTPVAFGSPYAHHCSNACYLRARRLRRKANG